MKLYQSSASHLSAPRISVIIPVFQEAKLIGRILQLFTPEICEDFQIEVIVSDGGSTDGTIEIAQKYTQKIAYHGGSHQQTIAEGRNAGAALANAPIFLFINGDTEPARIHDFLEAVCEWYESKKSVALFCPVKIFPDEEKWSDVLFHNTYNFYIRFLNAVGLGMGRGECQIIRREEFHKVRGYNANLVAGEDFDLFKRLAKNGSISTDARLLVYESPRRFRKYGYLRVLWQWTVNALSVMVWNRSSSKQWETIR